MGSVEREREKGYRTTISSSFETLQHCILRKLEKGENKPQQQQKNQITRAEIQRFMNSGCKVTTPALMSSISMRSDIYLRGIHRLGPLNYLQNSRKYKVMLVLC
uniref:Uncharacterized protein n=1 Tax=Trichobilharzia regenti TaxID=157069 RepID=A0AA85ISB4_TRIRE|nr:unnamed protein product [Trichobilharzia regenti]CAH8856812.1 unnamed protein product [Trichobilharzia regenti]